jgi:hypothetical protein
VRGDGALSGAGRVRVDGHVVRGRCLAGGGDLRFTSKPTLAGQSLYALVSYSVERSAPRPRPWRGAPRPGEIASTPPSSPGAVPLDRRRGLELVNLGRPLRVSLPGGARACVRDMAVGWLGSNGR